MNLLVQLVAPPHPDGSAERRPTNKLVAALVGPDSVEPPLIGRRAARVDPIVALRAE